MARNPAHTVEQPSASKRPARLSPSSSALSSSVVCAFFVTEWHTVLHAFVFLCRDVTSCGSACTLPFLGLLDADLDVVERGGGSDFEGFLVFLFFFSSVFVRLFYSVAVIWIAAGYGPWYARRVLRKTGKALLRCSQRF